MQFPQIIENLQSSGQLLENIFWHTAERPATHKTSYKKTAESSLPPSLLRLMKGRLGRRHCIQFYKFNIHKQTMPEHQLGWSRAKSSWGKSVKLFLLPSPWFCRGVAGQQPGRPHSCLCGLSAVIMLMVPRWGRERQ